MKWEHPETCMCDDCIKARTIARIQTREREKAAQPYIERRGGEIGSISVADALKQAKRG